MTAIVGHTGFVGGYLHFLYPEASVFHSQTINNIKNQSFDLVFVSGISAKKWIANREPQEDKQKIMDLFDILKTVQAKKWIVISTIDVYSITHPENLKHQDEDHIQQSTEAYGSNRFWFEQQMQTTFPTQVVIVRLPAVFGFGLRKNIVFDFIFKSGITINNESQFQWYDMQWFRDDISHILSQDTITLNVINLFPEPLPNEELIQLFLTFKDTISYTNDNQIKYNIHTKHHPLTYWKPKQASYYSLKRYLDNMFHSNFRVSQLCMVPDGPPKQLLEDFGIHPVPEMIPYRLLGDQWSLIDVNEFKDMRIYSMQGLFYPYKWKLDQDYDTILQYFQKLIELALITHTQILVFGSPSLRSVSNAKQWMTRLLTEINDMIPNDHLTICLEPNARYYGCNFLTTCQETSEFVNSLHLAHIGWMMDIGNMYLESEDMFHCIELYATEIKHVHLSTKDLKSVHDTKVKYPWIKYELVRHGYEGQFTLEMLHVSEWEFKQSLYQVTKTMDISTIGCGWYGAHTSKQAIEKGYNVTIYEKNHVFANVSSHNQNRLHEGFHYPRSFNTRELCHQYYNLFLKNYGSQCVSFFHDNLYFIADDSLLDIGTYKQIMNSHSIFYEEIPNTWLLHCGKTCLRVKEGVIDFRRAREMFETFLSHHLRIQTMEDITSINTDLILDCTYNELHYINHSEFEPSLYLILKKRKTPYNGAATTSTLPIIGFTVMDGPFFSIYPYDMTKELYTLTHVSLGRMPHKLRHQKWSVDQKDIHLIIEDVQIYYPNLVTDFEVVDYFLAKKHVMTSACASRELQFHQVNNIKSVACGKITGIFEFESLLDL